MLRPLAFASLVVAAALSLRGALAQAPASPTSGMASNSSPAETSRSNSSPAETTERCRIALHEELDLVHIHQPALALSFAADADEGLASWTADDLRLRVRRIRRDGAVQGPLLEHPFPDADLLSALVPLGPSVPLDEGELRGSHHLVLASGSTCSSGTRGCLRYAVLDAAGELLGEVAELAFDHAVHAEHVAARDGRAVIALGSREGEGVLLGFTRDPRSEDRSDSLRMIELARVPPTCAHSRHFAALTIDDEGDALALTEGDPHCGARPALMRAPLDAISRGDGTVHVLRGLPRDLFVHQLLPDIPPGDLGLVWQPRDAGGELHGTPRLARLDPAGRLVGGSLRLTRDHRPPDTLRAARFAALEGTPPVLRFVLRDLAQRRVVTLPLARVASRGQHPVPSALHALQPSEQRRRDYLTLHASRELDRWRLHVNAVTCE